MIHVKGELQHIIKITEAKIDIVFLWKFITLSGKRWGYVVIFLVWYMHINKMYILHMLLSKLNVYNLKFYNCTVVLYYIKLLSLLWIY